MSFWDSLRGKVSTYTLVRRCQHQSTSVAGSGTEAFALAPAPLAEVCLPDHEVAGVVSPLEIGETYCIAVLYLGQRDLTPSPIVWQREIGRIPRFLRITTALQPAAAMSASRAEVGSGTAAGGIQ